MQPDQMDFVQHWDLETANDFLRFISPHGPLFCKNAPPLKWIFRGVDRASYGLVPTAFRQNSPLWTEFFTESTAPWPNITNERQVQAEVHCLGGFFRLADAAGLDLPEDTQVLRSWLDREPQHALFADRVNRGELIWPPDELLSLLGLAQHHGLPTRLLDWTYQSKVAAYFAAIGAAARMKAGQRIGDGDDGRIAVYALTTLYSDFHSMLEPYAASDRARPDPKIAIQLVTAPAALNANLRAQKGLFTLLRMTPLIAQNQIDTRPLDEVLQTLQLSDFRPVFHRITAPEDAAPEVLWFLFKEDFTAKSIFPDFYGVVSALREESLWRRPWNEA